MTKARRHEGTKARRETSKRPKVETTKHPKNGATKARSNEALNRQSTIDNRQSAFTLVEMVVVIAIVLVLLGLVLPAASTLWENRKIADAETQVSGLLKNARGRAIRASGTESGLFFFIDPRGAQGIAEIEQDPQCLCDKRDPCDNPTPAANELFVCRDVFRLTGAATMLPVPMRVVPRYVVDADQPGASDDAYRFSADELANNQKLEDNPPASVNHNQRHRNHFTMVYSSDGQLLVGRDVLIRDDDVDLVPDANMKLRGDTTGLIIGYDGAGRKPVVTRYYTQDKPTAQLIDPAGTPGPAAVPHLVVDNVGAAINFPSVDGLLVYDDSLFNSLGTDANANAAKRAWLLQHGQPFYVNRFTGAVIRGPLGETN